MKKRPAIIVLAIISILCFSFGLVACGSMTINTKTPLVTYRVGDNVDCFDFFEYQSGVDYTFSYSVNGGESESIDGHTIYLSVPGVYSLTCDAVKGSSKASESTTFNVFDKTGHMILTNNQVNVNLNSTYSMRAIMSLSGYVILSEVSHEEYISTVKIYDNSTKDYIVYDLQYNVEEGEGVGTDDGFFDGKRFKFIYETQYIFTIVSETSGGKSTAEYKVTARENFDHIPLVNGNISYNESTRVVTWDEIAGAVSYRVKVDLVSAEVGSLRSLDINDYLVEEFQFFDLVVIAKDASGKEFAKLIVKDIVIAPEGSEHLVVGLGASVNSQTKTVTLAGKQAAEASSGKGISKLKNSYVAFAGDYGVGTYVEFTFTGNNLPNVCLFADEINENMSSDGGSGYLLMNGLYSDYRGVSVSQTSIVGENALICAYPQRMRVGGGRTDPLHNYIAASEQYAKYKVSVDTLFTQKYLREDTSGRSYKYVVGSFEKYGKLAIEVRLYDLASGKLVEIANYVTDTPINEVVSGNIIVYAGVKGIDDNTTFTYSQPYQGEPDERSVYWLGATENDNGSVTLNGAEIKGAGYTSQLTDVNGYGFTPLTASHIGFAEEYGLNTYIDVTFTGNNMPNIMFFADSVNADMTAGGGKGLLIASGMYYSSSAVDKGYRGADKLFVFGPDGIPAAYDENKGLDTSVYSSPTYGYLYGDAKMPRIGELPYSAYPLLTTQGLLEDVSGDQYKLTVGTFLNISGNISIDIKLYNITTQTIVYDTTIVTSLKSTDVSDGHIVLYGGVNGSSSATTFAYSQPYTATPDAIKVASNGAVRNADGSVTLNATEIKGAGYTSQMTDVNGYGEIAIPTSYIGFAEKYGFNTYIDLTFTGNNMPNVMFFADSINGDMTAGGGKGLLIASGMYYRIGTTDQGYRGANKLFVLGPNRIPAVYDKNKGLDTSIYYSATYGYLYGDAKTPRVGELSYSSYPLLTTQGLLEDTSGHQYKLTVGTFVNVAGNVGIDIKLYNITTQNMVYDTIIATTLAQTDVSNGHIVVYGGVKGMDNATTFTYSQPYSATPDPVKAASSGASKNADGSVTLAGRGVAGAGNFFQITDIDNSYVALTGKYGVGTYMDFTFTGNNMPTIAYFANNINGNMGNANVTTNESGAYVSHNPIGNTGMIFTNGFYMANTNGGHDFYRIYGMNRIYRDGSLKGGYREDTNYIISKKYGTDTEFNALTQKGLMDDYSTTNFKYTVGTYDDNGKLAVDITLFNLDTQTTLVTLKYTTNIDVSTVVADNIIIYGCVKGEANSTTFTYSSPYTKQA